MDVRVQTWWLGLSVVSVVNVALWLYARRQLTQRQRRLPVDVFSRRRAHLWLSLVYVVVCGFRSFLPRADVQRIVIVDSWLSSVALGRTVATVAEMCFAIQVALMVNELGHLSRSRYVVTVSRIAVPLIAFAEVASWYAVLSTNFGGNAVEQSTWTFCGVLVLSCCALLWQRAGTDMRRLLAVTVAVTVPFVVFMCSVDVPMYWGRFLDDQAMGRQYLPLAVGFADAANRWVVTHQFEPWAPEMAWMALYFSAGVWSSIALSQVPALEMAEARLPRASQPAPSQVA